MQQRQLRLGDILDDYCPRERRVTNHAIVAMTGQEVLQTRCTTCDADHEYKHAKVPRPRKKEESGAVPGQMAATPRRVVNEGQPPIDAAARTTPEPPAPLQASPPDLDGETAGAAGLDPAVEVPEDPADDQEPEEGPVHRPLIRATLPRHEGQVPPARPAPEFTIRQPGGGRPGRFRGRNQRGGQMFQGDRSGNSTGGQGRGPSSRPHGGRAPHNSPTSRPARRQDVGRKRSK
jgi:hypothetical protein